MSVQRLSLKVIAINTGVDPVSGRTEYQVVFGNVVALSPEIRERIAASGQTPPPPGLTDMGDPVLTLSFAFPDVVPYRLREIYELQVADSGEIRLTRSTS